MPGIYAPDGSMNVTIKGSDYSPSGSTPVSATISGTGGTSSVSGSGGRAAYAKFSGGTSAAGYAEYSTDGTNWFKIFVEGIQLGTFIYSGSNMIVVIPPLDLPDYSIRIYISSYSGSVNMELTT